MAAWSKLSCAQWMCRSRAPGSPSSVIGVRPALMRMGIFARAALSLPPHEAAARVLGASVAAWLSADEIAALEGRRSPEGVLLPRRRLSRPSLVVLLLGVALGLDVLNPAGVPCIVSAAEIWSGCFVVLLVGRLRLGLTFRPGSGVHRCLLRQPRLKNCTARSWRSAAPRVLNVPRL